MFFFHCCVKNNDLYKCSEGFWNILKNGQKAGPYRILYRKITFFAKMPIFSKPQRGGVSLLITHYSNVSF